jgi:hypothetical protein
VDEERVVLVDAVVAGPEEEEAVDDGEDEGWIDQLRENIATKTGITPEQLDGVMELVVAAIRVRVIKEGGGKGCQSGGDRREGPRQGGEGGQEMQQVGPYT